MKRLIILYFVLLGCSSFVAHAQEAVYDYALLKRDYIGKNEIFTIHYRNETGKTNQIDGYIRASANDNQITVYAFNTTNRNYDLIAIMIADILSINRSGSQSAVIAEKPKAITSRGILKAVAIVLISGGLALLIFHNKL